MSHPRDILDDFKNIPPNLKGAIINEVENIYNEPMEQEYLIFLNVMFKAYSIGFSDALKK